MPTFLTKISQTMLTGEKFFRSTHVGAQFFPISPGPCKRCWPVTTFFAQNPRYMLTAEKIFLSMLSYVDTVNFFVKIRLSMLAVEKVGSFPTPAQRVERSA